MQASLHMQSLSSSAFPCSLMSSRSGACGVRPVGCRSRSRAACHASATKTRQSVMEKMAELKAKGRTAFIPFITAGDPDLETTEAAVRSLDAIGADVIELGVPYSDPLADGPVIQNAATRALDKGVNLDKVIDLVRRVSPSTSACLLLFTYFNPIMRRGLDRFCQEISEAGASGLLVPDIPLEETDEIRASCNKFGLDLVLLVTPTTPKDRMANIAKKSQGFVYLVSVTGVTGVQEQLQSKVGELVNMLHQVTDKPVAVGFGVSKAQHAKQILDWGAEGVICGSALVKLLAEGTPAEGLQSMEKLARELRGAIP